MANRFIFLDRDGVINQDRTNSVLSRSEFAFVERAPSAIHRLNEKGYQVIVITNQACVGRGDLDLSKLEEIHGKMMKGINQSGGSIEDVYVCTHVDEDNCPCRKPKPGLLIEAGNDYEIELADTWFIGDDKRDMQAAIAAGCKPGVVRTGKGTLWTPPDEVPVFKDLHYFASHVPPAE